MDISNKTCEIMKNQEENRQILPLRRQASQALLSGSFYYFYFGA
ncbi:unknown protein [Simkania negevensis Z]|uniref:Uncharacterized protein n=1 Tax=Simkania negevensis (strain ATCC VR-1471 / DSM 27360 / Z) TaxID=331113 RepID=F8L8E9_SIMNZ|nr:unknown protein [Simkania negevensis Z]